ncbi:efflux RND transporter periplasmic adaptor subunit [Tahibacter amnicola]|uniref:HlyD family efflux transporter periplasmic adaptor subunit n=1 Tax=Tahibacter amnicola TaxID=2976241 RepID=A0ABY6BC07_9GAMM|nr:HlyD family efflux transporter periplasmic adaptor subunit [Tahibacter amnicola]UXI67578.1 HlyD family efflux transporter periplasmic adaptor subunit [Tahibacter amnicola]
MIRDTSAQDRPMTQPATAPARRHWKFIAIAAGVLLLGGWVAPGMLRTLGSGASFSLERLRVAEVKRGNLVRDISAQGRVVAAVSPTLYAQAAGTVTLAVQAGDKVEKGQIIAEVVSPELTNRLAQEQASLQSLELETERASITNRKQQLATQKAVDQAQIDRQTAAREVERTEKAFTLGALPKLDVMRATDALQKAEVTLAHANKDAQLERESLDFELKSKRLTRDRQRLLVADLQRQVDELKLRAPVSGQIGQLLVQQKANVAANAPLMTVIDLTALEVEVPVSETFARDLAIGMPAEIVNGADRYVGELSAVSPEVVNGQVNARVRFTDKKPDGLRQNQRLSTRILIDEHPNVLMVERGPFVDSGAGRVAYVVRDGMAERLAIEVGATSLNAVELVSGVKEGDRLIISGTDDFKGAERVALSR